MISLPDKCSPFFPAKCPHALEESLHKIKRAYQITSSAYAQVMMNSAQCTAKCIVIKEQCLVLSWSTLVSRCAGCVMV